MIGPCSIGGCENAGKLTRQMCDKHYARVRRCGTPHIAGYQSSRTPRQGFVKDGVGYVPLAGGSMAMVDPADLESVCRFNWHVKPGEQTNYAQGSAGDGWRKIKLHRFLIGAKRGEKVDHRNGNGLDNRRCNLRLASAAQNSMNSAKQAGKTSRFKGVCRDRGAWVAHIGRDGKMYYLGRFQDEEDAAIVYDVAAQLFFGEYSRLNFHSNDPQ